MKCSIPCFLLCWLGLGVWAAGCAPKTRSLECTLDAHCPAGEVCDDGVCRSGCRSDLDCASGRCDPVSRTCLGCATKDECELGELCVDGACTPGCEGNRDCPAGLLCLPAVPPHGLCAECAADGDCPAGERCVGNQCQSPCGTDADCPAGRCDPATATCVECLEVDDCALGELCIEAACTPGCKGDRDCPTGLTCLPEEPPHGACVECANPGDCPEIVPRACIEPLELDFGSLPPGETKTGSITVTNCGTRALTLRDYSLAPGTSADFTLMAGLSPPIPLPVSGSVALRVTYHPALEGEDTGGLRVYTDDPASAPVTGLTATVALRGQANASYCHMEVSPAAIDFGVVEVGGRAEAEVLLANQGTQNCVITGLEIAPQHAADEFSLVTPVAPGTIVPPAGVFAVTLAYVPADLGRDTGALSISVDDVGGGPIAVALEGQGRAPGGGPVAVCGVSPTQAAPHDILTWTGGMSYDPNPGRTIQAWRWTVVSFPGGSTAVLADPGAPVTTTRTDVVGSYTAQLVVHNDLGQESAPCTATAEVSASNRLSIMLTWQHAGDDLDLHLLAPNGIPRTRTDCYFGNCTPPAVLDWGVTGYLPDNPHLDLDDIPGTGPELINLEQPAAGVYTVLVHDYPGSVYSAANRVTVIVYIDGVVAATLEHDMLGEDTDWYACDIDWPSGTITPR